jgi:hypothetical protein
MEKCPKCHKIDQVYKIWHVLVPAMGEEEWDELEREMEEKRLCWGSPRYTYKCKRCDTEF